MSDPTVDDTVLRDILEGCAKATPGPWEVGRYAGTSSYRMVWDPGRRHMCIESVPAETAEHIAHLDPQTVASIITELLALRNSGERP